MKGGDIIPRYPHDATPEARSALAEGAVKSLMERHDNGGGATIRDLTEMVSRLLVMNVWAMQRAAALEKQVRDLEDHLTAADGGQRGDY